LNQPYQTIADLWAQRIRRHRRNERIARVLVCVVFPVGLGLLLFLKLH